MEIITPAATKAGEATNGICLKASMFLSKRQGEESVRLGDRILKLEGVDGTEELKKHIHFRSRMIQTRQSARLRRIAISAYM